jgi:ferredoxin-NADP reductase
MRPDEARVYVGFAAGSGITPILSIVKGVLAREPTAASFLFYGNRSTSSMLFLEELEELKDRFMQRLVAVPCHLGRRAGYSDPARPARRRESARAAALAGAGGKRRSRLHLRPDWA